MEFANIMPAENDKVDEGFMPLDVIEMQTFRDEVAVLHIKNLEGQDINPLHLTGQDRVKWEQVKNGNFIADEEFREYFAEIENDEIDAEYGLPRYFFSKYLLDLVKSRVNPGNIQGRPDGSPKYDSIVS